MSILNIFRRTSDATSQDNFAMPTVASQMSPFVVAPEPPQVAPVDTPPVATASTPIVGGVITLPTPSSADTPGAPLGGLNVSQPTKKD